MTKNEKIEAKLIVYESYDNGIITLEDKKYLLNFLDNPCRDTYNVKFEHANDFLDRFVLSVLYPYPQIESGLFLERNVSTDLPKIHFAVYGDGGTVRGFGDDPYFKIFDGLNFDSSKNKVRISFQRNEYVYHDNDKWDLSGDERKLLMKYLTTIIKDKKTLWELLIDECIKELKTYSNNKRYNIWIDIIESCRNNMPDYSKITKPKKNK